jgi:hypothetical protein
MKLACVAILSLLSTSLQETVSPAPVIPPGPTVAETKAWLELEAVPILQLDESKTDRTVGIRTTRSYHASAVSYEACKLSITFKSGIEFVDTSGRIKPKATPATPNLIAMNMKDLDVGGVLVHASTDYSVEPTYSLRFGARLSLGPTVLVGPTGEQRKIQTHEAGVRNQEDGQRLANAVKRAGILCGAPAGPF